jgi:hypothetical protein
MAKVLPGPLVSVTNLVKGFLEDLTPVPDGDEAVEVSVEMLSALENLARTFVPKNEREEAEISYVLDSLQAFKAGYTGAEE